MDSIRNNSVLPAVEVLDDGRVRILDKVLPRSSATVLTPALPSDFCLDERTLRLTWNIAASIVERRPLLAVGPTASSKTSCMLFAASLLGRGVERVNLGRDSDVSDLVGRYVPQEALGINVAELRELESYLSPAVQEILRRAAGRPLQPMEERLITGDLHLPLPPFVWADGPLPRAMREGSLLLLEEANLAPSGVLERSNCALEFPIPSLVITEGPGTRFGVHSGCVPVHPEFMVLATMNPPAYAGRQPLSPAWLNRWAIVWAEEPGTDEHLCFLRALVKNEQPVVVFAGSVRYQGCWPPLRKEPAYPRLAGTSGVDVVLENLARAHARMALVARSAEQKQLPGRFPSWRDLRELVNRIEAELGEGSEFGQAVSRAIERVYLEPYASDDPTHVAIKEVLSAMGMDAGHLFLFNSDSTHVDNAESLHAFPGAVWQAIDTTVDEDQRLLLVLPLEVGQTLEASLNPHAGNGHAAFEARIDVYGPDGKPITTDKGGKQRRVMVAAAGPHVVHVIPCGAGGGSLRLAYRVEGAVARPSILPDGRWRWVCGKIAASESAVFHFWGEPDQVLSFSTSPSTGGGKADFDTVLSICRFQEQLVTDDDGGDGQTSLISGWKVPRMGLYEVKVSGYSTSAGEFRLAYRREPR